jgi:DnaJ-class molecular chaperone
MADTEQNEGATAPPRECSPCRGTGRVISNLGGSPQGVTCPWCDGTGRFVPGHDAQARHRGEAAG